jgi:hypothetical protein
MGMFDTVFAPCPRCKDGEITVQTKAGECYLERIPLHSVPLAIADDIDGQWMSCGNCEYATKVRAPWATMPRTVSMVIDQ